MSLQKRVGTALLNRRKELGLTLSELGHRVGLSVSYLSQIETGSINISMRVLETLSAGLNCDVEVLLKGRE